MSAPFIALTMAHPITPMPIFINVQSIRSAHPRWVRQLGTSGPATTENHNEDGTWICTGSGDDMTFNVVESYGEVTGAIRDALA